MLHMHGSQSIKRTAAGLSSEEDGGLIESRRWLLVSGMPGSFPLAMRDKLSHDQAGIMASKAEGVAQSDIDLRLASCQGYVIHL